MMPCGLRIDERGYYSTSSGAELVSNRDCQENRKKTASLTKSDLRCCSLALKQRNKFVEDQMCIVHGIIQCKDLFDFFPYIGKEWFNHKAAPALSFKRRMFINWGRRQY